MAEIRDVAQRVLDHFVREDGIASSRLQRLVFLCHAWALGLNQEPLTGETYVLWANGPASVTLHEMLPPYTVHTVGGFGENLTREEKIIVDAVVRQYGALTGLSLSKLIEEQTQWLFNRGTGAVLTNELIRERYSKILNLVA